MVEQERGAGVAVRACQVLVLVADDGGPDALEVDAPEYLGVIAFGIDLEEIQAPGAGAFEEPGERQALHLDLSHQPFDVGDLAPVPEDRVELEGSELLDPRGQAFAIRPDRVQRPSSRLRRHRDSLEPDLRLVGVGPGQLAKRPRLGLGENAAPAVAHDQGTDRIVRESVEGPDLGEEEVLWSLDAQVILDEERQRDGECRIGAGEIGGRPAGDGDAPPGQPATDPVASLGSEAHRRTRPFGSRRVSIRCATPGPPREGPPESAA